MKAYKQTPESANLRIQPNKNPIGVGTGYPDNPQDLNPEVDAKAQGNPNGIKIRGTGCATKGVMARGPLA